MALFGLMLALNSFIILAYISSNRNNLIYNPLVKAGLPFYRGLRELTNGVIDSAYFLRMKRDIGIPQYRLVIKSENLRKLNDALPSSLSDDVISGQVLLSDDFKDTVPAEFYYDNKKYEVKVRYRGENANHWTRPKKSWQIKFDKDTPFNGLMTLKLIIPDDRGYFAEMLNNYRAQKLGLFFPQMEFAQFYVNNDYHGVYLAIEDFTNEFLETSQKPPDANIYVTDDQYINNQQDYSIFDNIDYWRKQAGDSLFGYENFSELDFLLKRLQSPDFADTAADIIDMDSFYHWNITAILAGSSHQGDGGNVRLYFNNVKGKFEFIPWDVELKSYLPAELNNTVMAKILNSSKFYAERNQRLWNYVKDDNNLADDLRYYDDLYNKIKPAFYSDLKKFDNNLAFNRRVAEVRSQYKDIFNNIRDLFKQDKTTLDIRHDGSQNLITFSFRPNSFAGLSIKEIALPFAGVTSAALYADSNANGVWDNQDIMIARVSAANNRLALSGLNYYLFTPQQQGEARVFARYEGDVIKDISKIGYAVVNAITGENVSISSVQFSDLTTFANFADISLAPDAFVKKYPMFKKQGEAIVLPAGSYVFDKDIVAPKNITVRIEAGVNIALAGGVSFVSYSPVEARGTSARPIVFRPLKVNEPWGSFGILNNGDKKSTLEYVDAAGGGSDYINGSFISGMVSVYYSDAVISHITISESHSDDGLNLKYSNIEVANSLFKNNSADGLDLDYDSGVIRDSIFMDNGNDGIDLSGSKVVIKNNKIKGSGDKCISIGEDTVETVVFNTIMDNCQIGIQVKDNSRPFIINSVIVNSDIGVNAFLKKSIYLTGGHPKIYNSIIRNNKEQITYDEFSDVKIFNSNITDGYGGEKNFDEDKNYLEVQDQGRGNTEILKQYLNIDAREAPVGLWKSF